MSTARIYVGTYAKYSSGSIEGAWIDLEGLDKDEFFTACKGLHKDEEDPELMFQDFEGFPRDFYGESSLDDRLWDYLELDEQDREAVDAWLSMNNLYDGLELSQIAEAYRGRYSSPEDFAEGLLEDTGQLQEIPKHLRGYFDFEKYARDLRLGGDYEFITSGYQEVHVFEPL